MPSTLHDNVFSILGSPITTLTAGIVIGLVIGRITAPSTRQHHQAASKTTGKSIPKRKEDSTDNESSDEEPGHNEELQDFTNNEECKLVLVVRTDLGMGKGTLQSKLSVVDKCAHTILLYR
jgi:hypothetical protein